MSKKRTQPTLFPLPLPKHIVVVRTDDLDLNTDADSETLLRRMFAVPLDKSILIDRFIGRKRGDDIEGGPDGELADWLRLQALLNSRVRGKRFNFLGDSLTAKMFRESIRTKSWIPKFRKEREQLTEQGGENPAT